MSTKNHGTLSAQWVVAYHSAIIKAWENESFKHQLLLHPKEALKSLHFEAPTNVSIQFAEVINNDFSVFPLQSLSIFDMPQTELIAFKVPIPAKAPAMKDSLEHITEMSTANRLGCCCICA